MLRLRHKTEGSTYSTHSLLYPPLHYMILSMLSTRTTLFLTTSSYSLLRPRIRLLIPFVSNTSQACTKT